MAKLAIFAILPLILLGALLAVLIATGVLDLKPSGDGEGSVMEALLLGPVGVVITGRDDVELTSADGLVTVSIPAGSVSSPITLNYQESSPAGMPELPSGYVSTGRFFELSATSADDASGPVVFQRMLSIRISIEPGELALFGRDYSRLVIQHFLDRSQTWDALTTIADPITSTVTAQVGSLSRFALTVGPSAEVIGPTQKPAIAATTVPLPIATHVPEPAPTAPETKPPRLRQ